MKTQPDMPFMPHQARPTVRHLRKDPRILITAEAFCTMLLIVERAPLEVGWQGTVIRAGNDFLIENIYLLKQNVTAATTKISAQEGRGELGSELIRLGAVGIAALNNMRFWGHSHVRMAVEASGRDEMTMDELEHDGLPWAVRGIFNKCGNAKFSLFLYDENLRVDDVPWLVVDPVSNPLLQHRFGNYRSLRYARRSSQSPFQSPSRSPLAGQQTTDIASSEVPLFDRILAGFGDFLSMVAFEPEAEPEAEAEADMYEGLPPELIPSDELRAKVNADYEAKVDESGIFRYSLEYLTELMRREVATALTPSENAQEQDFRLGLDPLHAIDPVIYPTKPLQKRR